MTTDQNNFPLSKPILDRFFANKDFTSSQTLAHGRYARLCARVQGTPYVVDIDLVDYTVEFHTVEELKGIPLLDTPNQQRQRAKVRTMLDSELAIERITEHCINCEFFGFHGAFGPQCSKYRGRNCQNENYRDPTWGCPLPIPKFKPVALTIGGKP